MNAATLEMAADAEFNLWSIPGRVLRARIDDSLRAAKAFAERLVEQAQPSPFHLPARAASRG